MKSKKRKRGSNPCRISPENAVHNLDIDPDERAALAKRAPQREVGEADFAAEAHGFSAFEAVGYGSDYDPEKDES